MTRPARLLVRVGAMASKEVMHIRRDPRTLYMALAMPVVMLLIFGFGVSFDMDHIPLVVLDGDHSAASRALVRAATAGHEFAVAADSDEATALRMIRRGQALAALAIPMPAISARWPLVATAKFSSWWTVPTAWWPIKS
jgi:ABC-2 type transport system permease protein